MTTLQLYKTKKPTTHFLHGIKYQSEPKSFPNILRKFVIIVCHMMCCLSDIQGRGGGGILIAYKEINSL